MFNTTYTPSTKLLKYLQFSIVSCPFLNNPPPIKNITSFPYTLIDSGILSKVIPPAGHGKIGFKLPNSSFALLAIPSHFVREKENFPPKLG